MSEIIPAILPESIDDLKEKVSNLPTEITFIHLDVLEEDIWIDFDKNFEVHLMVKRPEEIIEKWIERGARRIIVHKIIEPKRSVKTGLAVELGVPLENIFPLVPQVDFLHLMSIDEIGEQGHPFDPKVFDRIREVREKFPRIEISVDGGISVENYQKLIEAGANRLIVGSHFKELWQSLMRK